MRRLLLIGLALAVGVGIASAADSTGPTDTARHVTMHDGTRIAIDLWLPSARKGRIPAIIRATRYWRSFGQTDPTKPDTNHEEGEFFTASGYALVLVDVRGSGASFGRWPYPWARAELDDLGQIVDWIVRQPWSNGRVGAYGASYEGNTADFLATRGRTAVKAIVPISSDFDPYISPAFPGGILTDWFVRAWDAGNHALDRNDICGLFGAAGARCRKVKKIFTGVKPVDADRNGRLLRAAVKQHAHNADVYRDALRVVFRDDRFGRTRIAAWSPYSYLEQLERGRAAVQAWAGWMDAGTVDGVLSRFVGARNAQSVLIGPWSHAALNDADPFNPPRAPVHPTRAETVSVVRVVLRPPPQRHGATGRAADPLLHDERGRLAHDGALAARRCADAALVLRSERNPPAGATGLCSGLRPLRRRLRSDERKREPLAHTGRRRRHVPGQGARGPEAAHLHELAAGEDNRDHRASGRHARRRLDREGRRLLRLPRGRCARPTGG